MKGAVMHLLPSGTGGPEFKSRRSDQKLGTDRKISAVESSAARFTGMSLKKWRELERGDSAINWYDPLRSDLPTIRAVYNFVHQCGLSLEWLIVGDEFAPEWFAPEPIRHRPRLVAVDGKRVA
jgi:hypothetical protein